jgi:magnesium chelatase family protein
VLFLDELPEWDRRVLEALREPLEAGVVHVARALRHVEFPARFQLVAAMNPCPCGWHGDPSGRCACPPDRVTRYRGRISGPLLDRIDLTVEVAAPAAEALSLAGPAADAGAQALRESIAVASERQRSRQRVPNAQLDAPGIARHCAATPDAQALLSRALSTMSLSARGYHRIAKVARTIADLAGDDAVDVAHVAEAIGFRCADPRRRPR